MRLKWRVDEGEGPGAAGSGLRSRAVAGGREGGVAQSLHVLRVSVGGPGGSAGRALFYFGMGFSRSIWRIRFSLYQVRAHGTPPYGIRITRYGKGCVPFQVFFLKGRGSSLLEEGGSPMQEVSIP